MYMFIVTIKCTCFGHFGVFVVVVWALVCIENAVLSYRPLIGMALHAYVNIFTAAHALWYMHVVASSPGSLGRGEKRAW